MTCTITADERWRLDATGATLADVLADRTADIRAALTAYGAVLVRGMQPVEVGGTALLDAVTELTGMDPCPYTEQSSPRTRVGSGVFTATDYPAHAEIFPHNELSYATAWPRVLGFYCDTPADEGGATTLVDSRAVLRSLPDEVRDSFTAKDWSYVRNLRGGAGLDWPTVFQTTSKDRAREYCEAHGIGLEWVGGGARIHARRPALLVAEPGGPASWFNHVAAFHVSTQPPDVATALRRVYAEPDLPVNTYYGTGEPIPDEVVATIRAAYREHQLNVDWRRGDLVLVDNHRVAHGRLPFAGTRKVFVLLAGEERR